jgi:hypothetical protein
VFSALNIGALMTTAADLDLLDQVTPLPANQRLTALIRLLTEHEGIDPLARHLGYANPGAMRVWLRMNRTPLNRLPAVARYLGVDLGLLACLWLCQEAEPEDAEAFFHATAPRITDAEFKIVDMARQAISEDEDDAAEARLVQDIRKGALRTD